MPKIGDLSHVRGEATFQWKVEDFLNSFVISDPENGSLFSSKMHIFGQAFRIRLFINSIPRHSAPGYIGVFLERTSTGSIISIECCFSLLTLDGQSEFIHQKKEDIRKNAMLGHRDFMMRSVLIERQARLLPGGCLTLLCTLKKTDTCDGFELGKLNLDLKKILLNASFSNVILKVEGKEFSAHQCILAARSPVFAAMFTHNTKEKMSGTVEIKDVDVETFPDFLAYLYSGYVENITTEKALKLYTSADRYHLFELKILCVSHIQQNISVENFCDTFSLAMCHSEENLKKECIEFFSRHSLDIVTTSTWKDFLFRNPEIGNNLFIKQLEMRKW